MSCFLYRLFSNCTRSSVKESSMKEWRSSVEDIDNKCRDLLLQEHYLIFFFLMDSFWDDIKDFNFDLK